MERTVRSTRAFDGSLLGLRVDEVERPGGRTATREIVEHPGAVAVLAWDGERLALVRQWRHAAGASLLEVPAGTIEHGEATLRTAQRELGEEMGLAAGTWVEGPSFYTAPGFCTERLTLFLATDLSQVDVAAPDDEDLDRSWLPLAAAIAAIDGGEITDAKSIVGVLWLARRLATAG
jgi:8-oxo-dGTP pyrophosphatase MutT (NUDIX family)